MQKYSILIPVALPSSGPELCRVARLLAPAEQLRITALHCRREAASSDDASASSRDSAWREHDESADDVFEPLLQSAGDLSIEPHYVKSARIEDGVLQMANDCAANLIMMGWHRPLVHDDQEPGPVRSVIEKADCDVAVFLARQFRPIQRVLVPFHGGRHDLRALEIAARIARSSDVRVTVLHVVASDRPDDGPGTGWSDLVEEVSDGRVRLRVVESDDPVDAAVQEAWTGYDIIVAGASEVWGVDFSIFSEPLQRLAFATPASLLVVRAPQKPRSRRRTRNRRTTARTSGTNSGS